MSRVQDDGFAVDREVAAWLFYRGTIAFLLVLVCIFGLGAILACVYAFTFGRRLSRMQSDALSYWLEGSTLRVDEGVFWLRRKAIPLDRITDVVIAQGPFLRWCGTWALQVQTAGRGQATADATLYG